MATSLDNWTLEKWLKRVGMGKYKQSFIDNGYETPDLCANLSKEDLDAVGVTNKHHRSTLFTQARKLLKLVDKDRYLASMDEEHADEQATSTPAVGVGNGKLPSGLAAVSGKNGRVTVQNPPAGPASQPGLLDYSEPWSGNVGAPGMGGPAAASNGSVAAPTPAGVATGSQPGLMDYSEPWSGNTVNSAPSDGSGQSSSNPAKPIKRVVSGTPADTTDGPTSKKPLSPNVSNDSSSTPRKEGSTGMTKLQFKLKIREELFHRNVVLSEAPYCTENGTPDEGLMLELAAELSEKFDMESLTMYDALKEVWSNANKCSYNPAPAAPKVKIPPVTASHLGNYDEPFDTTNATSPKPVTPSHRTPVHMVSTGSTDNYDEPFDTTNPTPSQLDVPPSQSGPAIEKSSSLPSSAVTGGLSNYDEPFDTLSKGSSSPEKTKELQLKSKESSKTLPSPRQQRKTQDSSTLGSPRHSPARAASSKSKFGLFKKKDKEKKDSRKARAVSMKESGGDVQFIQDKSKESSSHGLIVTFGNKSKGTSSEDIPNMRISPSTEQLSFMQKGQTPPLPSPRPKMVHGSSGESDDSPQLSGGQTKTHSGATFRKFTTPPVSSANLQSGRGSTDKGRPNSSHAKSRFSQGSEDEDSSAWLTGSKSFDELNDVNEEVDSQRVVDREKKSRTSKLFKRIFKRKTMTPGSMKQSQLGGGSTMMVHRSSKISNGDEFEDREGALMASISMPDIAISRGDMNYKSSLKDLHNYSEIEDSPFVSEKNLQINKDHKNEKENKKVPLKPPRKSPRPSPRPSPQHSPSPTLDRNTVVTSPPLTIPRTSHRQVIIRGVSESSTPDQTTIPIIQPSSVPSMRFDGSAGEDGAGSLGGSFSEDHVRIVKPSDVVNHSKDNSESSGLLDLRDLLRTPSLTRSDNEQKDDDTPNKRLSSVSSNTSDTSSSSKPAKKPKPPGLSGKRPMKGPVLSPIKSSSIQGSVVVSSPSGKSKEAKSDSSTPKPSTVPPPKPARTLPRKSRHYSERSFSSSSASASPTHVSFEQEEDPIGKEVFSPTGEGDFSSQRSSVYSTSPTSPLSPLSPNTLQNSNKPPPPKPSRKARSVKVVGDHSAAKEDGGGSPSSQLALHYPNATLPSKFKPVSSATPPGTPTSSSKPKPVPRTRRT